MSMVMISIFLSALVINVSRKGDSMKPVHPFVKKVKYIVDIALIVFRGMNKRVIAWVNLSYPKVRNYFSRV